MIHASITFLLQVFCMHNLVLEIDENQTGNLPNTNVSQNFRFDTPFVSFLLDAKKYSLITNSGCSNLVRLVSRQCNS